MNKKITIALCIPTYERCDVLKDFFITCVQYYIESGIDIYIYDSSISDDTRKLVLEWRKKYKAINYVSIDSEMHSNMKVYEILSGYGLNSKYDFIWVSGDAIQFSKCAINDLMDRINLKYDIIEMDGRDYNDIGTKEYTKYNDYLVDCAWELTLYGSAILNTSTILNNVDWNYYKNKYNKKELINFSHVGLYFSRICEIPQFRALHISVKSTNFMSSLFKHGTGWKNNTYFIFCESWVNVINSLPKCYNRKCEAIFQHGKNVLLRSEEDFIMNRRQGILNYKIYRKYYEVWSKVTPVKRSNIMRISIMPIWLVKVIRKENRNKRNLKKLEKFSKGNSHLYIFGAGIYGTIYEYYLNSIGVKFDGFVVTSLENNKNRFSKAKVYKINELKFELQDAVIVAVKQNAQNVINELKENHLHNIFYEPDFIKAFYQKRGEM